MPTVGELNAKLTGTDAGFKATLDTGAAGVDKFGGTVNQGHGHVMKFNAHMLESRKTIGTFAAVVGTSTGPLMHLVHAFSMAPGPIGLAIAGFLILKEVLASNAEKAKEAAAEQKKLYEISMKINELKGIKRPITGEEKEIQKDINEKEKALIALRKEYDLFYKVHAGLGMGQDKEFEPGRLKFLSDQKRIQEDLIGLREVANKKQEEADEKQNKKNHEAISHAASPVLKAVFGAQLSVLKLEHGAQFPQIALLEKIARNTEKLTTDPVGPQSAHFRMLMYLLGNFKQQVP